MKKSRCLIIEDEPLAQEVLTRYIANVPFLEVAGIVHSATEGLAVLREEQIDVIFLDLHLPGLKGFDFLKTLSDPPHIIVTTAYHQYAVEGYDLDITDYLLKPIAFERFLKAVNRIQETQPGTVKKPKDPNDKQLIIKEGKMKVPVMEYEINYLESQRDYVIVFTNDYSVKTKSTLLGMYERLTQSDFLRIHKSYIIRVDKVTGFSSSSIQLSDITLPIGRSYQAFVKNELEKL